MRRIKSIAHYCDFQENRESLTNVKLSSNELKTFFNIKKNESSLQDFIFFFKTTVTCQNIRP
ncbi:hypothetical protein DPV73_02450 [Leptospira mayottensis]|nr:hypothetical protein DPV73_02450 [Leptospira mayottensis]